MKGVIGGLLLMSNLAATTLAAGPLTVDPDNPRYFTDGSGKAIYLTGSHVWANLPDISQSNPPAPFQYQAYLDFLEARGHNFVRLWTWAFPHFSDGGNWYADPFPWPRTGPGNADDGKPKFDLSKLNQDYFDRMRDRIVQAQARGMYVSVLLFDGYAVQFFRSSNNGFPFDAANNVNGINAPGTSSTSLQYSAVTALQETYVRKVIDTVNDLDNVLYEIANEAAPSSTSWQSHMIDFIRSYEATKPKQHPIGTKIRLFGLFGVRFVFH